MASSWISRSIIIVLILLLLMLQYRLWLGDGSIVNNIRLNNALEINIDELNVLKERNEQLASELTELKSDSLPAYEALARRQLGMIKKEESFYLFNEEIGLTNESM